MKGRLQSPRKFPLETRIITGRHQLSNSDQVGVDFIRGLGCYSQGGGRNLRRAAGFSTSDRGLSEKMGKGAGKRLLAEMG